MTERGRPAAAPPWAPPHPARPAGADARGESLPSLVDATAALAAAATVGEVCRAAVAGAIGLTGARAAALGSRDGGVVRLLASEGYDCDSMTAGSELPLDAGLPVTECVRTGGVVSRGTPGGPAWVAVPVVTAAIEGALLVSLPPWADVDVDALATLGRVTADALRRCTHAAVPAQPAATPGWLRLASLDAPWDRHGGASGDVLAWLPGAGADVGWLVVADTCGSGAEAAPTARAFRRAVAALVAVDLDAPTLLATVDVALRRDPEADRFVTALVARVRRTVAGRLDVEVASAGHPPALVWRGGSVEEVGAGGALPLNLLPDGVWTAQDVRLEPGDLLLAYTDGLVERPARDHGDRLVELLARSGRAGDAGAALDLVVTGMHAVAGAPRDDFAVAVLTPA